MSRAMERERSPARARTPKRAADPRRPSEHELLELQRTAGNAAVTSMLARSPARLGRGTGGRAIQRYAEKDDKGGKRWRVSDGGKTAVAASGTAGSQELLATPDLVKDANGKLAQAGKNGSFIRLKATAAAPKSDIDGAASNLRAVEPRLVSVGADPSGEKLREVNKGQRIDDDGSTSKDLALHADCGRASRAVMGTGDKAAPAAHVTIGGKEQVTGRSFDPADFTAVYKQAMPEFMKVKENEKFLKEGVHLDAGKPKTPASLDDAKRMYWELGADGRLAFDRETGMNTAANPEVGGAYGLATERSMPGFKEVGPMTWNFHWAGVVMKDGADNVTLENYAVSYGTDPDPVKNKELADKAYDEVNRAWVFQLYGTKKKGQSFHEQHLATGTHGTRGSTFATES